MKVEELMEILKGMPKDARICVWDKDRFPHEIEKDSIGYYSLRKEVDIVL